MIKLEPIEGWGWFVGDKWLVAPPAFMVEPRGDYTKGSIRGIVRDASSAFDGFQVAAQARHADPEADQRAYSVRLDPNGLATGPEGEMEITGYAVVTIKR